MKSTVRALAVAIALAAAIPLSAQRHPAVRGDILSPFMILSDPLTVTRTQPDFRGATDWYADTHPDISANSGTLFFTRTHDTLFKASREKEYTARVGLRYINTAVGVQGIQFTLNIPNRVLRVKHIRLGRDIASPGDWIIDYQVKNGVSGSEVKVIAFGRDTTASIPAGVFADVITVVFERPDFISEKGKRPEQAEIYLSDVQSALATRYGYSASIGADAERGKATYLLFGGPLQEESGNQVAGVERSERFELACAPNPFTGSTTIHFAIAHPQDVTITIVDEAGHEVARPLDCAMHDAGDHAIRFDAAGLPSGRYFCAVSANQRTEVRKLVVMR